LALGPTLFLVLSAFLFGSSQTGQALDDIRVFSTGIGLEERQPDTSYSAQFVFSERKSGSLLTDIQFSISTDTPGRQQKILEMDSAGPWVFADLPPGRYSIRAVRNGAAVQSAEFTISGEKQEKIVLSWE
jgi:hypothetical protein